MSGFLEVGQVAVMFLSFCLQSTLPHLIIIRIKNCSEEVCLYIESRGLENTPLSGRHCRNHLHLLFMHKLLPSCSTYSMSKLIPTVTISEPNSKATAMTMQEVQKCMDMDEGIFED